MVARQASFLTSSARRLSSILRSLSRKAINPTIIVEPSDALVDEPVSINVTGLRQGQKVTLSTKLTDTGTEFLSCAHYTADVRGQVKTSYQPSEGGSFTEDDVLASTDINRWYMGKGVQRIPVREGRIRGVLFIPPGEGPFPTIIDMFGASGGLFDFRGALLASRGYLTLSLAYLYYEDLPRSYEEIKFDYFTEATDWLSQHDKATPGGIGVMGVSFGGGICFMLSAFCPKIRAAVVVNGFPISTLKDQMIGDTWVKGNKVSFSVDEDGKVRSTYGDADCNSEIMPIWRQKVKILSFMSEDDKCIDPERYRSLMDKIPKDESDNIEIVYYPGAGHLLEPPYTPHCSHSYVSGKLVDENLIGLMFPWGGEIRSHAIAQEDAWKRTLKHFNIHLRGDRH